MPRGNPVLIGTEGIIVRGKSSRFGTLQRVSRPSGYKLWRRMWHYRAPKIGDPHEAPFASGGDKARARDAAGNVLRILALSLTSASEVALITRKFNFGCLGSGVT